MHRAGLAGQRRVALESLKVPRRETGDAHLELAEAGGFATTDPDLDVPDVQFHFAPTYLVRHGFEAAVDHAFSLGTLQLRPRSRGRITLRSTDPFEPPDIDPRYLSERRDREVLLDGIEMCRAIVDAEAFDPYRGEELHPGPGVETRDAVEAFFREHAGTLYHPVRTCAMGNADMAVVDDKLRVHGVAGLRVVDASVMPHITRGNTNVPTIAIGEKAADLIMDDAATSVADRATG